MSDKMVVVVTGANRGIGLAICELILQQAAPSKLYATSRAGTDLGFQAGQTKIVYTKLDVQDSTSIKALATEIKSSDGHVDVLINNAGINTSPKHDPSSVSTMLDTNYRGTLAMCQAFTPLLSKTGRIVNLSSTGSGLHIYSPDVQARFRDCATLDELEQIAQDYERAVSKGNEERDGFGRKGQGYSVSKACVNAFTAILARENRDLVINACCPGWVDTDMGGIMGQPPKAPVDGARIPVRLGFGNIDGVTGRYWANDSISSKGDGKVQKW